MNLARSRNLLFLFIAVISFASCDPSRKINKDYLLFQHNRDLVLRAKLEDLTFKPGDLLAIQVYSNSLNQEQAAIFNIAAQQGYLIDKEGKIEFPILGKITAAGFTREDFQKELRNKLTSQVKDPSVIVRLQNFTVNVLGDVGSPGTKNFPTDKVTILDAISASGDLAPTGKRENVTVIRDHNGIKQLYEIDLRSNTLFESPVYQLQQNDIVYVNANESKLKSLKEKKDWTNILRTGLSILGTVTSLYLLFTRNN